MLPIKIDLTPELATKLRDLRVSTPVNGEILTAENLSKSIGNNRAWMSQIESRRLKKIKREDVIAIYKLLFSISSNEEAEMKAENDLLDYLVSNATKTLLLKKNTDNDNRITTSKYNRLDKPDFYAQKSIQAIGYALEELYEDAPDATKENIAMQLMNLMLTISKGKNKSLKLLSSLPLYLCEYASDDEYALITEKVQEVTDLLNVQRFKEFLESYNKNIKDATHYLNSHLPLTGNIIRDFIDDSFSKLIFLVFEKTSTLSIYEKIVLINDFISLLTIYAHKIKFPLEIDLLTKSSTEDDLKNTIDYLQSYMNVVAKKHYYMDSASEYFK